MAGKKVGSAVPKQAAAEPEIKPQTVSPPNIRVRIHRTYYDENKKLRAFASANIGDFAVHGLALFENENGWSVAMPKYSYNDANGNPVTGDAFHPVTAEARKALGQAVVDAYKQTLLQTNTAKQDLTDQQHEFVQKM